jgi:DNA-binding PadR family transcriptional regulator
MSSQRSGVLELAVLGILHETPMHGYELRKRLNSLLGAFRAFGYGSLYPALKELLANGLIAQEVADVPVRPLDRPRRSKIVYRVTAEGMERLQDLLAQSGPASWLPRRGDADARTSGQLHPGTPAARPRISRARSPLA